jgi:hypothetical protein
MLHTKFNSFDFIVLLNLPPSLSDHQGTLDKGIYAYEQRAQARRFRRVT